MKRGGTLKRILLGLFTVVFVTVGGYAAYVLLTYSRIDDNLPLKPEGDASRPAETGKEYTVVTYNVGFGAYTDDFTFFMDGGKESRARSRESVIECISGTASTALSFSPDFALFQEVDTDSTRSHHVDEVELIEDLFDQQQGAYDSIFAQNYHSAYLMVPPTQPHGASNSGILTMSRFEITSGLRRSLPIAKGFKKLLDLDRCYSISRIPVENGKELVLFNVHTSAYGTDASQGNAQLEMLFGDLEKEYALGNYIICGGDFNHDFTGDSRHQLNPGKDISYSWTNPFPDTIIPNGFRKCLDYADGLIASCRNTDIPYSEECFTVVLDGFIVSDNVRCEYVQNIDTAFRYTDHNPVVMKFTLEGDK